MKAFALAALALVASATISANSASALSISPMPDSALIDLTSYQPAPSCDLWGRISSRNSNDAVTFNFVNETSNYRIISWLGFDGQLTEYATLEPGDNIEIDTYYGHPWMIQDGRGDCMEVIEHGGKIKRKVAHAPKHPKTPLKPKTPNKPVFFDNGHDYEVSNTYPYGGFLNLRHGPSVSYGKIGKLPEGYELKVLKRHSNGWAQVKLPTGHKGWVNARFLTAI